MSPGDKSAPITFSWRDPLQISARLTEDEILIADSARNYAVECLLPRVEDAFEEGRFDPAIMREMGALGLLGATLPDTYGGAGVSHVAYGLIAHEVEAIDSGYRSAMSVQSSLVMFPIFEFGSEEQRRRYLPELASGEMIGCFGLTEPDGGSDPGAMRTTASKVPGGYRLNGAKMWITNSPIADIAVVWAKLEGKIRGFIVDRGAQGFSTPTIKHKLSLRTSITGEIGLDDCFVPENAIFPEITGLRGPLSCLNKARYGISWGALGAARSCFEASVDYAGSRMLFGRPLAAEDRDRVAGVLVRATPAAS